MSQDISSIRGYLDDIREIIKIATERSNEYWSKYKDGEAVELSWDIDDLAYSGKEKELFDYISALDYEEIKTIQTIMYIGRDGSCAEEDGTYDYFKTRKYMDMKGWNEDKDIEVMQIVQKVPLADYLRDGCRKIDLI